MQPGMTTPPSSSGPPGSSSIGEDSEEGIFPIRRVCEQFNLTADLDDMLRDV